MNSTDRPKLFHGYFIVGACFILMFDLWGMILNTMPIFLKPITMDMGWSRGEFSIAVAMGGIGTLITAPIAGKLFDRFGAKPIMLSGSILIGLGLMGFSQITSLWQLYLINVVIGAGLMFGTIIPCSALISNWFEARRGTAMGIAFSGTAIGGLVMTPIASWMINTYGWRTVIGFGGIQTLLVTLPVILLIIKNHPSDMGLEPYRNPGEHDDATENQWGVNLKEAVKLPIFWQLFLIMLFVGLVNSGYNYHCVAYLSDLGHSQTDAAFAWSVVMGAMVFGKFATGPIADKIGAHNTMGCCCIIFALSILLSLYASAYTVVLVFACIYGFSLGAPLALNPLLTSDNLGMKHYGIIFAVLNISGLFGGAAGPVIAGKVFDANNTYLPVFYTFIAIMILTSLISFRIKRPSQKLDGVGIETGNLEASKY